MRYLVFALLLCCVSAQAQPLNLESFRRSAEPMAVPASALVQPTRIALIIPDLPANTIVINTARRRLYVGTGNDRGFGYSIGVGKDGMSWKGRVYVGAKAKWPGWTPPPEMLKRRPDLPRHMAGGVGNPLGARALYLFNGPKDTLFRIHGTNEPETIGHAVSSGCFRMLNEDVIHLYSLVSEGATVIVE